MKISIIGLGYVGLPLAIALGRVKSFEVVGFDIDIDRINQLRSGHDRNGEESEIFEQHWKPTFDTRDLAHSDVFIVCVPTPINSDNSPDLFMLQSATKLIAKYLRFGNLVVYESTVWPGLTEDICGAMLQQESGLILNQHFSLGYSPERINPGDREHTLRTVTKVIACSNSKDLVRMRMIYGSICRYYVAESIKVAEAAKCIENIQRDVNIALMNELKMLFDKMDIDTQAVLNASKTKWNFLDFKPGLVGGHCIGVDPYYLAAKAKEIGFDPKMILTGRHINDNMPVYWFEKISSQLNMAARPKILVLGCTFKANVSDIRNSKVFDLIRLFGLASCYIDVFDPLASKEQVKQETGIELLNSFDVSNYDAVIMAVNHSNLNVSILPSVKVFDISASMPMANNVVR